ncbi:unnamed protein product [Timema podura]|uniref:Mutator-like transposase domain-containing protein n=1 Tax=Timema podura TaxID=61482 RepID=A0ABN7NVW9_TIMPD|nr:unnamed protein product [Timema podura]
MHCWLQDNKKKVLYMGVLNYYCSICERASSQDKPAREHVCYKNWTQSATATEADIIVDGFKQSVPMYGIVYAELIGDVDSSVMKRLIVAKPIGPDFKIKKIEFAIHILRNYVNRVKEIGSSGESQLESLNSVVTKFISGKRINYALRGSYQVRCSAVVHIKIATVSPRVNTKREPNTPTTHQGSPRSSAYSSAYGSLFGSSFCLLVCTRLKIADLQKMTQLLSVTEESALLPMLQPGDWVALEYDDNVYPGAIVTALHDGIEVNTMGPTENRRDYKWPIRKDEL